MVKIPLNLSLVFVLVLLCHSGFAQDYNYLEPYHNDLFKTNYFQSQFKPNEAFDETLNVRINSDTTSEIQNEQQICINPTNPENVVAVWRDFRLGYRRVGVGYSFDGGFTWTDDLFPATGRPWHSDPGLTYDLDGNFYAVVLAYEPDGSYSGFEVFKSTDGGITWGDPVIAIDGVPDVFEDKELIGCDRVSDSPYQGNLYIVWKRFDESNAYIIYSSDGGATWSSEIMISDGPSLQWVVPVVGAGGVVYVPWVGYYSDLINIDRSYDGGQSWGEDIIITEVYRSYYYLHGNIKSYSFPAMDADISGGSYNGNLYVAYMDKLIYEYEHDCDIFFRRSTDDGETWSERLRINDDEIDNGCDQFHPWLVVDENGVITVMFYDRRNDPENNLSYDIYLTQSFDAGVTWTENHRITTESSNPGENIVLAGKIGEYSGLAVRNGYANLAWTDWRLGDQDTYSARVMTYTTRIDDGSQSTPLSPLLIFNYPNPFNSATTIQYYLPATSDVTIDIYDIIGRRVETFENKNQASGKHQVTWQADNYSTGLYFYKINADGFTETKKMLLLK